MGWDADNGGHLQSTKIVDQVLSKLITSIVEGSITYGPYATFVTYLWLSERTERRAYQQTIGELYQEQEKKKDLLTDRTYKALNDSSAAMNSASAVLANILSTVTTVKDFVLAGRRSDGEGL